MATKVKPTRLNISGTPQVGQVPVYVDEDTFQWGSAIGDVKVFKLSGINDYTTAKEARDYHISGGVAIVLYLGYEFRFTSNDMLCTDVPSVFSSTVLSGWQLILTVDGSDNVTQISLIQASLSIPSVIDNLTSTSTTDALSANQGKVLNDKISDLFGLGKFLSLWDATTGLPISFPLQTPYSYTTGDYFLVETVSTATPPVNYKPTGSSYSGTASTTQETGELEAGDVYIYDGSVWLLQSNHGKTVAFANIAGQPTDNANLATALGNKLDASALSNTAYGSSWNGDTTHTPTKDAVYDKINTMDTTIGTKANDSDVVKLTGNQSIDGTKTFTTSPVVPSKTTDATNTGTAIATEAQVYKKQDALTTQTAYTSQGTSTKVPTITTNTLGQVTGITETSIAFPVTSVNGDTGTVTLDADDISDSTTTNKFVTSTDITNWNGKQNALATQTAYTSKGTSTAVATITTNTLGQVTAVSETNIAFPVTSVNGSTGAVSLSIPTKTSDLNNDSGFLTSSTGVTSFNGSTGAVTYTAPVTSVNGNTGAVTVNEFSPSNAGSTDQVLTKTASGYERANAAGSDYSWVTKTISGGTVELGLRTIINVPTGNFTLTAPATLKDGEEYAIRIISGTSYTMTLGTGFTNPRNVDTTLSGNATDQYVFLAIGGELELQPLVDTGA